MVSKTAAVIAALTVAIAIAFAAFPIRLEFNRSGAE